MPRRRLALVLGIATLPIFLSVLGAGLHQWGKQDRTQRADAIIVFGAYVNKHNQASPILRARTRRAFELWQRGLAPLIVCTGGIGDFPPAEAVASKKLLEGWGVPPKAILVDDKSTSTRENAQNAAALLPPNTRAIGVSEPFHLWRCRRDCAIYGIQLFTSPEIDGWNRLSPYSKASLFWREAILVTRDVLSSPIS